MRTELRRLAFGLSTLLGLKKRGFFIPYRYADQVPDRGERGPYFALERIFEAARPRFSELLRRMDAHAGALSAIGNEDAPEPRFSQDWFPRLDACAAYAIVRDRKPGRIVEVGSGHSTRFMARAIRDENFPCAITAIDPAPRASIDGLGVKILRRTVQEAGPGPFELLEAGDILFIDSSHILMPGTDVDFLFNHVLPALAPGVLIHIHDIFLPDDYPPEWQWRGYNEQLAVGTLLQGRGYTLLWSSHYAKTRMTGEVGASIAGGLELKAGAHEASVWVEKS
jgi:predicted O-methyltransferase YrrM